MSSTGGTASPQGQISMKIIRSLGNLHERTAAPVMWFQRFFPRFTRNHTPIDNNGLIQSSVVLKPCLTGKVLRLDITRLAQEQLDRVKQLLLNNEDVTLLASPFYGAVEDLGVMSLKTVTDNGVSRLAEAFAGVFTLSNFKFHGFGTGTTAEAEAHANLVTEVASAAYAVAGTRPTGSQANTAAAGGPPQAAIYTTIATYTPPTGQGTLAITEHGLFAIANGVGAGANTMWDRSVFSVVNLVSGSDSLQVTYNLSLTANG
jgi:hypothetical protein